jgi:hypothetical protein
MVTATFTDTPKKTIPEALRKEQSNMKKSQ